MSTNVEIIKTLARLEANQESMKDDIRAIKEEDIKQNQSLAEHIAGVNTNREIIQIESAARKEQKEYFDARLEELEFLPKLVKGIYKVLKWLAGGAIAITTIMKFLGYF